MKKYLLILILLSYCGNSFGQLQFEEIDIENISQSINPISGSKTLFFINSSNNGFIDLLVRRRISYSSYETLFFRNNGSNVFSQDTNLTVDGKLTHIIDYDFDNNMDIVSYPDAFEVIVQLNDGNGNFANSINIPSPYGHRPESHSFADVTNDMNMDLVASVFVSYTDSGWTESQFLVNNGDDTFTGASNNITSFTTGHLGVQFIDFDNDGDFDIYTNGTMSDGLTGYNYISRFFINDGNGLFPSINESLLPNNSRLKFVDFNNDEVVDAFANNSVFLNDGLGGFSSTPDFDFSNLDSVNDIAYINYGNLNGDNFPDIIISKGVNTGNSTNPIWNNVVSEIHINDGNGSFNLISDLPFQDFRIASSDIADIDSNGSKEIILHARDGENNVVTKLYTISESLSTEEFQLVSDLVISPNPTIEYFKINGIEHITTKAIAIFNISGQLIKEFNERNILERNNFNVSTLSKGIYIIEIKSLTHTYYKKLIRQ